MKIRHQTALKPLALSLLAGLMLVGLPACSKDEKPGGTQVAAKVNSQEISVHQVNYVLGRSGANPTTPEQTAQVRKAVLDRLVDQQIAVDEALEKKLDRQPDVVLALDLARREVLSRAYVEQIAAGAPKPSPEEVKKYFADNPALFIERRIFSVQELIVPQSSGTAASLRELSGAGKTIEEIAAWLKSRNVQFNAGAAQRSAEQIPLEMLPRIHALKDGQSTVIEGPQAITVVRVVQSQAAPVAEAQALPRIQQYLANQRANEAAAADLKRLKEKAKISYVGDFAAGAAAPAPAPAAQPAPPVSTPAGPAQSTDSSMEKGVRGIK
jgi:EpsD family peptidyl-prolyl cis-trans isomerase